MRQPINFEEIIWNDNGLPTILYKTVDHMPIYDREGDGLMLVFPEQSQDMSLGWPPPLTGRRIVLFHPSHYPALADACAGKFVLMEWIPQGYGGATIAEMA